MNINNVELFEIASDFPYIKTNLTYLNKTQTLNIYPPNYTLGHSVFHEEEINQCVFCSKQLTGSSISPCFAFEHLKSEIWNKIISHPDVRFQLLHTKK